MPLVLNASRYVTYPSGNYLCVLSTPKLDQREPYSKRGTAEKEDCVRFEFTAVSIDDEKKVQLTQLEINNDGTIETVTPKFIRTIGTNFGSPRAAATKLINQCLGQIVPKSAIEKIDLLKLKNYVYSVTISKELKDDGSYVNNIASIELCGKVSKDGKFSELKKIDLAELAV